MGTVHLPVMPAEVVRFLGCRPGGVYVDCTLGGGGHALEMLKASSPDGRVIGLDVDEDALEEARRLLEPFGARVIILRENYRDVKAVLERLGVGEVDGMVLDVGVSSYQLERAERGFSFMHDSRLDMRMDRRIKTSAYDLVNGLPAEELERIFRTYGEERRARTIAKAIVRSREKVPVETTGQLARIVLMSLPPRYRHGKIHPATRVFQALRIAVNNELENLEAGLRQGVCCLRPGGRMVVISFHSLEDRIVKNTFREISSGCICPRDVPRCVCGRHPLVRILTKKVVVPGRDEVESNPRARSAKLRAVERVVH